MSQLKRKVHASVPLVSSLGHKLRDPWLFDRPRCRVHEDRRDICRARGRRTHERSITSRSGD